MAPADLPRCGVAESQSTRPELTAVCTAVPSTFGPATRTVTVLKTTQFLQQFRSVKRCRQGAVDVTMDYGADGRCDPRAQLDAPGIVTRGLELASTGSPCVQVESKVLWAESEQERGKQAHHSCDCPVHPLGGAADLCGHA